MSFAPASRAASIRLCTRTTAARQAQCVGAGDRKAVAVRLRLGETPPCGSRRVPSPCTGRGKSGVSQTGVGLPVAPRHGPSPLKRVLSRLKGGAGG